MNKSKTRIIISICSVVFWLLVWELSAKIIDFSFILPGAIDTLTALVRLIPTGRFWLTVLYSLLRIIVGLTLGITLGVALGYLSAAISPIYSFLSPIMTVIRCTPVASFIMIVWFLISSSQIPTVISILMVLPIIWQSTTDAFAGADKELLELSEVFDFSITKKIKYIYAPTVNKYLLPAIISSMGLAWKAGVAAEIITYTKLSIGAEISNAKNSFEGAEMLAWTITVIILSLLVELILKNMLRRLKKT